MLDSRRGLQVDETAANMRVVLPAAVRNDSWPQPGGNPAHLMGHLASGPQLTEAWTASIGAGGGYRDKILAQPVVANGVVYAMDSDAKVTALDLATGAVRWSADTKGENDDSTNVGGGVSFDSGTLYAVNGLSELVAFDAATGTPRWRHSLPGPARSSPTIADGRLFVVTLDGKLVALSTKDGSQIWVHTAASSATSMLGQPAPAFADGLVVAGFGSGELASLRADTGSIAWTDSLASTRGRTSIADISAIRGLPVIADGRVYAIGLGGLLVALDLRSGRRLWEREVGGEDSPWVAGDWLFIISSEQQIAAIQRQDGRVAWVGDLPRFTDEEKKSDPVLWFGPALAGNRLVVAGTGKEALSVSPSTGEILGHVPLTSAASLGPVVADGMVLIVTNDGKLLALR